MPRKPKNKEDNAENQVIARNQARELEEFYVNGTVNDLLPKIQARKEELVQQMTEYAENHDYANPIIVTNKFFKSINPVMGQEPIYSAETLGMVFDYYCDLLAEVNDKIGSYPSSLTAFCKLAGISLYTLKQMKVSDDYNMRVVVEKIYDQIGDENITMSQMGVAKEKTTLFKMKAQNELVEKAQPQVKVNVTVPVDMDKIKNRIAKYSNYIDKKGKK